MKYVLNIDINIYYNFENKSIVYPRYNSLL